MKDSN